MPETPVTPAGDEAPVTPLAGDETPTEPAPTDPAPGGDELPPDMGGSTGDPTLPPPPVELPPPPDYQVGVNAILAALRDESTAPRWSTEMDSVAVSVRELYDFILPIAYEVAGTDPTSRSQARDAASSLVLSRISEEVLYAHEAAEQADQPVEPPPVEPPPPVQPPAEG